MIIVLEFEKAYYNVTVRKYVDSNFVFPMFSERKSHLSAMRIVYLYFVNRF